MPPTAISASPLPGRAAVAASATGASAPARSAADARHGLLFLPPRALPAAFILLWSTGYISGKTALGHAGPWTMSCIRFACVALVLLGVALAMRAPWPRERRQWLHLTVVGLLVQGVQFPALYSGLKLGVSAGVSALIVGLMPIVTAVLAGIFLGERSTARQWIGLVAGLFGVALVVSNRIGTEGSALAYGCCVLALLALASGTLYQKRFCAHMDLRSGACIQFAVAALATLAPAIAVEGFAIDAVPTFFAAMGWMVVVNSIIGTSLLFIMIRQGSAAKVSSLFYLVPGVAALFSYLAFGETLTPLSFAGFAVTAGAVWLCTRART